MSDLLEYLNEILGISDRLFCLLLTLISILVTIPLGLLASRIHPYPKIVASGDGISSFSGIIGILYAIILGYVLVTVYGNFCDASTTVEKEVTILIDFLRDAEGLPADDGKKLQIAALDYVDAVIDLEWNHMKLTGKYHPEALRRFSELYRIARSVKCQTQEELVFLREVASELSDLSSIRFQRVSFANARVPDILWGLLLGVGAVSYGMSFLFPVESTRLRIGLLCATAAVMTFTTLLIFMLDRPYKGSLNVKPESLIRLREVAREVGSSL